MNMSGNRFGRKRPSMLSEFHDSKHYHNTREGERESLQHYRSHSRYSHDTSGGGGPTPLDHAAFMSSGFHSKTKPDSRDRHSRHHNQARPATTYYHSNSYHHPNSSDSILEEENPVKRPRLMVDVSRRLSDTTPSSADSVGNSVPSNSGHGGLGSPVSASPWPSGAGGLSPYLEDIDSDDDSLLQDKKPSKSPTPVPTDSPAPSSPPALITKQPRTPTKDMAPMPSKEELLMMMEKVDRDIATAETQISALEKKRVELEETARTAASTPHSSTLSSLPSPTTPPENQASALATSMREEDTPLPSPASSSCLSPKRSQMDIIYSENRMKSKAVQASLSSISYSIVPGTALYHQPCESPHYYHNIRSHQVFRPKLVQHIRKRKLEKHKKDLQLCEEYDALMTKWERSVERIEANPKKKLRDQKNREMFERHFPELKLKRDHQERMTRVDQRGYPIVRSDAELKEIMYELCEQEEGPVRNRKTHAVIPPMLTDEQDRRVKFFNENGLISDPMALHRDSRFINIWSEEEKAIFREKYTFYPKNFEVIASFLPNKTPADCVQYYYLTKKRENFKHLVRKANLKRKKPFVKPSDYSNPQLSPLSIPPLALSLFASAKPKTEDALSADEEDAPFPSEFGDWSSEEISSLKEGLCKHGRAWGKIYQEVGGMKTASQCKQFYDEHRENKELELSVTLTEHSSMKSAEKIRRKAESHSRKSLTAMEGKKKAQKPPSRPSPPQESEEMDSENTASAYDTDSNSENSTDESTITDSSPEDGPSNSALVPSVQPAKLGRGKRPKPLPGFRRTSEEALDLFISAAEALSNIIPPEVALHDHSYALPPSSIINNVELQGTSGLSLIAAAAAVVSPTLSKSAASTKLPSLSPVRAPRGRPPNSQRKGTNGTSSKLAPTLLSPAGTSPSVLLTEMKAAPMRGRARSAPSDRPKVSTLHVSRPSSTLARMSINSSSRMVSRGTGLMSSSSYSRYKGEASTGKGASSLKSMIAFQPQSSGATASASTTTASKSSAPSTSSTSAFEALVNVAVAAPPAELPCGAISGSSPSPRTNSHSTSSSSPVPAFTATPLSRTQPCSKDAVTIGVAGSNSNASNSTTTAYIDVNQAINILASLAQQQVSSSSAANGSSSQSIVLPNSRLFTQNSVNLLGNIVSQGAKAGGAAGLVSALPTPKGGKALSVSATVDTLLGHLTSGLGGAAAQGASSKSAAGKTVGAGKAKGAKSDVAAGSKAAAGLANKLTSNTSSLATKLVSNASSLPAGVPQSIQLVGNMDDLSNLNLLSSLVAAVAASQSGTATPTTAQQTTPSTEATLNFKTCVGQASNHHGGSKTEVKRSLESVASSLATVSRNSSSSLLTECTSNPLSHVFSQSYTSSEDGSGGKPQEHSEKQIAASSSIKKASMQSSSSVGSMYGVTSSAANELPRSVVRTGLGTMAMGESLTSPENTPSESDMTASLASIIPPYNPSMSSQSSLLLYTRSLSFPMSVAGPEPCIEEEDHLESATRGISELSKLLGTDSNSENSSSPNTKHDNSIYNSMSNWNPAELLTSTASLIKNTCGDFAGGLAEKPGKPYLSSLLESQIHGTVHHTPLAPPKLNSSTTDSGRTENMDASLDVDHSR